MPPSQDLRASDADRDATCERLRTAALEGRLDPAELDERLTAAYASKWCGQLEALTADVTPAPVRIAGPAAFVRPNPTNGLAVASLICGLLWMMWLGSLLAIVFGHVALGQVRRSKVPEGGRGLAIAGLALGYFGALTLAVALLFAVAG